MSPDDCFLRRIAGLFNDKNRIYGLKRCASNGYFILTPFLKQPGQVGDFGAKKNLRLFPGMKKTNLQFFNQNLHIYDIAICVPNLMIFYNLLKNLISVYNKYAPCALYLSPQQDLNYSNALLPT